jgi:hypothetical protein
MDPSPQKRGSGFRAAAPALLTRRKRLKLRAGGISGSGTFFEDQSKEPQPAPPSAAIVLVGFALSGAADQLARSTTPGKQQRPHMACSRTLGDLVVSFANWASFLRKIFQDAMTSEFPQEKKCKKMLNVGAQ